MPAAIAYVTAESHEDAIRIGRGVVEQKLAACANVIPSATSIYWWEGKLEQAGEALLILKTRTELAARLTEAVVSLHPYECPCVVIAPITDGNPDYLRWIDSQLIEFDSDPTDTPAD